MCTRVFPGLACAFVGCMGQDSTTKGESCTVVHEWCHRINFVLPKQLQYHAAGADSSYKPLLV